MAYSNSVESRIFDSASSETAFETFAATADVDFERASGEYSLDDAVEDLANGLQIESGEDEEGASDVVEDDKAVDGGKVDTRQRPRTRRQAHSLAEEVEGFMTGEIESTDVGKMVEMLLDDAAVNDEMLDYPEEAADEEGKCQDCQEDCTTM